MVISPSDCLLPTQPSGKICSFKCARGYQVSGPSSARCGIGGSWSEDANTIICDGLYLDILSFTSPLNCSFKDKPLFTIFWIAVNPTRKLLTSAD